MKTTQKQKKTGGEFSSSQYGQNNHLNGMHFIEAERIRFDGALRKTS